MHSSGNGCCSTGWWLMLVLTLSTRLYSANGADSTGVVSYPEKTIWAESDGPPDLRTSKVTRGVDYRHRWFTTTNKVDASEDPNHISPNIEARAGERGEEFFLGKGTIKHSITELILLSQSHIDGVSSRPSCLARINGPRIEFTHCPGPLTVTTLVGSKKMTCREITSRQFYGLVFIRNNICQQSFQFNIDCVNKEVLEIDSNMCPSLLYVNTHAITLLILAITITVLVVLVLWLSKLNRGAFTDSGSSPFVREGFSYVADYEEKVLSDGKTTSAATSGTLLGIVEKKKFRISFLKFLILTLSFRNITVNSYELVSQFSTAHMKFNYVLTLGDSENVPLGGSSIIRSPVKYSAQLTHMFDTAPWTLEHLEEYYCQWWKCEVFGSCGYSPLPFTPATVKTQELFHFGNLHNSYHTCQKLTHYCMFGNGCKVMGFEIIPDLSHKLAIYSVGRGGTVGGSISVPSGCLIEYVDDKSSGEKTDYYVATDELGSTRLCHRDLFSAKPTGGLLGDLQILEHNRTRFMSNEVACVADYESRSICHYPASFIASIDEHCLHASQMGASVQVDTKDHSISWKMSGEATVSLICDRELPLTTTSVACRNIDMTVWEITHLDARTLLSFTATSEGNNGQFLVPPFVHVKTHLFPCNGIPHITELYDIHSLSSSGANYSHEVIPYDAIDNIQREHFSSQHSRGVGFLSHYDLAKQWAPLGLTTTALGAVIVLLCVICCRR